MEGAAGGAGGGGVADEADHVGQCGGVFEGVGVGVFGVDVAFDELEARELGQQRADVGGEVGDIEMGSDPIYFLHSDSPGVCRFNSSSVRPSLSFHSAHPFATRPNTAEAAALGLLNK